MEQIMTVFVVNQPARRTTGNVYDISPATEFGLLDFVFTMNEERPSSDPDWALDKAHNKLSGFDPNEDYVLWAGGDPFSLAVITSVLTDNHDFIRFLKWERHHETREGAYVAITLDLGGELDEPAPEVE
jgi:hypothetical protein